MELTRPSGKETKYIQNIYWILIENGIKTNCKIKPTRKEYYPKSTVVEYYTCDIYGKQRSNSEKEKFEYDYYYCFFKGNNSLFYKVNDIVWTLADCRKKAKEYFTANKVDTVLCIAKIYNSTGNVIDSTNSNRTAYMQHLAALEKQKRIADSIQAAKIAEIKNQEELSNDSIKIANSNAYDEKRVEKRLKILQEAADTLQKGQKNLLAIMNIMINEAISIVNILEAGSTFDKDRYFGTADLNDLRMGIRKLLEINRKKAEKNKAKIKEQSKKVEPRNK
jgi:hypothetical protein